MERISKASKDAALEILCSMQENAQSTGIFRTDLRFSYAESWRLR